VENTRDTVIEGNNCDSITFTGSSGTTGSNISNNRADLLSFVTLNDSSVSNNVLPSGFTILSDAIRSSISGNSIGLTGATSELGFSGNCGDLTICGNEIIGNLRFSQIGVTGLTISSNVITESIELKDIYGTTISDNKAGSFVSENITETVIDGNIFTIDLGSPNEAFGVSGTALRSIITNNNLLSNNLNIGRLWDSVFNNNQFNTYNFNPSFPQTNIRSTISNNSGGSFTIHFPRGCNIVGNNCSVMNIRASSGMNDDTVVSDNIVLNGITIDNSPSPLGSAGDMTISNNRAQNFRASANLRNVMITNNSFDQEIDLSSVGSGSGVTGTIEDCIFNNNTFGSLQISNGVTGTSFCNNRIFSGQSGPVSGPTGQPQLIFEGPFLVNCKLDNNIITGVRGMRFDGELVNTSISNNLIDEGAITLGTTGTSITVTDNSVDLLSFDDVVSNSTFNGNISTGVTGMNFLGSVIDTSICNNNLTGLLVNSGMIECTVNSNSIGSSGMFFTAAPGAPGLGIIGIERNTINGNMVGVSGFSANIGFTGDTGAVISNVISGNRVVGAITNLGGGFTTPGVDNNALSGNKATGGYTGWISVPLGITNDLGASTAYPVAPPAYGLNQA